MISNSRKMRLAPAFLLSFFIICQVFAGYEDPIVWRPVSPDELTMKSPKVEADADAEAIFWEVRLDDKRDTSMSVSHYVRVKIFTERGRERFAKMDIPFVKGKKVEKVAARVIKPDGSIVELSPSDIFEREIVKQGKAKVLAKSFAVPGIEPGVIVEYQYTEKIKGDSASGERLWFQRDIPMQKVTYYVRPHADTVLTFNPYNMDDTRFVEDKKDWRVGTMYDVPALKEEPYMPPDDEVRRWVYLRYMTLGSLFQWGSLSHTWAEGLKKLSKPNKEVKAKAAELTAGAATDEDKIKNIYAFVQKNIKNVYFDRSLNEEQVEKLDVKDADDALKKGMGGSFAIDMLFASLARAAGFEVNVVLAGDRSDNFFDPQKYPYSNFVQMSGVAVRIGNTWRYFDPCAPYMPFEALPWTRQNVRSMIIGDGGYAWKTTPLMDEKRSVARRSGEFKLLSDGSLEGEMTIAFDGHQAISRRMEQFRDSESKREEDMKEEIKQKITTAEITSLRVENFDDNTKPLTYKVAIKVPNYAQKVGKRLILQPGVFEYGSTPAFSAATRKYDICFPYPWSEEDSIAIALPSDYVLADADTPGNVGDPSKISNLTISMSIDRAKNRLKYNRSFYFGGNGHITFSSQMYTPLKGLFDAFHKADTHSIVLNQK